MKIYERLNTILNDPSASYWLKDALRSALRRDIVDALNDAEALLAILQDRFSKLSAGYEQTRGGR
jgi:hypothetical protein